MMNHARSIPGTRRHFLVAPILLILTGCPETPWENPVFKDAPDLITEGLTPEQADAIGADSHDIPANLTGVIYNGIQLGPPPPPAKSRGGTAGAKDAPVPKFITGMLNRGSALGAASWSGIVGTSTKVQDWGLSYVYGSKDPNTILSNLDAPCGDFGLDCSGFIGECVRAGGIPLYPALGTEALSNPKTYNDKIPASWSAAMVYIHGKPTNWMTGDILIWNSHQGIAVQRADGDYNLEAKDNIWNSAGSKSFSCQENRWVYNSRGDRIERGPTAWPLEKYNTYNKDFQGVLRMYEKPTVTISAVEVRDGGSTRLQLSATIKFPETSGGVVPARVRLFWQDEGEVSVPIGVNGEIATVSRATDGLKAASSVPIEIHANGRTPTPVSLTLRDPDSSNARISNWTAMFTASADDDCDAGEFAGASMETVVENGRSRNVFRFTNTHPFRKILINFYTEVDPAPAQTCGDAAGVNTNGELIHSWYLELGPGDSFDGKGKLGGYGGCEGGTYPRCGQLTPHHVLGYRYWARYTECKQDRQDDGTVYVTMPGATSVFPCPP